MEELLVKLFDLGVQLRAEGDKVVIIDSDHLLTCELRTQIEENEAYLAGILGTLQGVETPEPIPRATEKSHYVLSSAQRRLYFLYELEPNATAYNMPRVVELEGQVDVHKIEKTFRALIKRHGSLRTNFEVIQGETYQTIRNDVDFSIAYYESSRTDAPILIQEFIQPFNLKSDLLIRVGLIKLSDDACLLMVDMHHIITDGVSQGILIRDFMSIYSEKKLQEVSLQYKDYAEWQQGAKQQSQIAQHRLFWLDMFQDEVMPLHLPTDFSRPITNDHGGGIKSFALSTEETKGLRELSENCGATMFMTILSIFNVLLSKLSYQEDITIGTPVAGRGHEDLEEIIGMFVNTLVLRCTPKEDIRFDKFLTQVKSIVLSCFDHQQYQYEELIGELNMDRDTSRNPLFDVMFAYQNYERETLAISNLVLKPFNSGHYQAKFDLMLTAMEMEGQLQFYFEYATSLFHANTIDRFIVYFCNIITAVIRDPGQEISQIEMLSDQERNQLLHEFNNTRISYPKDRTVIDLFQDQVERIPNRTALIFNGQRLSYKEFHSQVNHVTFTLLKMGLKRGHIVGIICERSLEMMVGIYGIMKAGGAYLPIDPNYPSSRIDFIVENSGLKMLLSLRETERRESVAIQEVNLEELLRGDEALVGSDIPNHASPSDLAYVIYTSGSTGKPKGVMITHQSLMNRLCWMDKEYPIGITDVLLQKTPIVFDVSVWELFWWSQKGAVLCLLNPGEERDPVALSEKINEHQVTTIHFVPSMLQVFLMHVEMQQNQTRLSSLRQVFSSGEALTVAQVRNFQKLLTINGTRLINLYGPTEATIDVTYYNCDESMNGVVPIGKPIANTSMYVLNRAKGLQPIGVPGELCIAGEGLALGYLDNQVLTDQKFIDHPFKANERLYKTGDLARWLPDGNLEFLGRLDDQVKIHGHRIELGEISYQLSCHEAIHEAIVVTRKKQQDIHLVAYYLSDLEVKSSRLRSFLLEKLPAYMVPQFYVHMDNMPLTTNGKINRRKLPGPVLEETDNFIAPTNELEGKLVEIFSMILDVEVNVISANRSFFELGGNSLNLLKLSNMIVAEFDTDIRINDFFQFTTVTSIAKLIQTYTLLKKVSGKRKIKAYEIRI